MKTRSRNLLALFSAVIWALSGPRAAAQGTIPYTVFSTLHTGGGQPRVTATQTFTVGPNWTSNGLQFAFGFATEEQPAPDKFLDSATVTFQDSSQVTTLVYLTVDGNGVTWAPVSPGATFLDPSTIKATSLGFNDQSMPWTYQTAYWVTVPIPASEAGKDGSLYLDLYDNGDTLASMGWISQVPEPGTALLLLIGAGVWMVAGRLSPVRLARVFRVSLAGRRSAGFQPAVSRISNPQARPSRYSLPTGSRRYRRLETCATRPRNPVPPFECGIDGLRALGTRTSAFVPEGHRRIARRFNAGEARRRTIVPKGRLRGLLGSSRPFGTDLLFQAAHPALKRRAILRSPFGPKRRRELTRGFNRAPRVR